MRDDVWEQGSDFAYPELPADAGDGWQPTNASYWHSGRDALRALVRTVSPRRMLFPAFYCQDVFIVADEAGIPVQLTDGVPDELRRGDLLVVSNNFGLETRLARRPAGEGFLIVEDHTHDPFSTCARSSEADYAFASLRKWLPIPDGAVLWSPRHISEIANVAFDSELHRTAAAVSLDRLTGMLLKREYLAGKPVQKTLFRRHAIAGESAIGGGSVSPMTPLARVMLALAPVGVWREKRAENHRVFVEALGNVPGVEVRSRPSCDEVTPFAAVLVTTTPELRERIRASLVARAIYPAVLWPLDPARAPGMTREAMNLSARILCLHCDHRYEAADMRRVAHAVRNSAEGV